MLIIKTSFLAKGLETDLSIFPLLCDLSDTGYENRLDTID